MWSMQIGSFYIHLVEVKVIFCIKARTEVIFALEWLLLLEHFNEVTPEAPFPLQTTFRHDYNVM